MSSRAAAAGPPELSSAPKGRCRCGLSPVAAHVMSEDGQPKIDAAAPAAAPATEPLACVSCRARKLKCDRTRPACARCLKVNAECVYPESRRKPAFKRRNVKELEARLESHGTAQVEVYLKESNSRTSGGNLAEDVPTISDGAAGYQPFSFADTDALVDNSNDDRTAAPQLRSSSDESYLRGSIPAQTDDYFSGGELMPLGLTEHLPPFELMEELNNLYFANAYHQLPVVHQGRYLQAFYSDPMRRPPMCLQYAIWALGAQRHEKYQSYAEVFYKRARHYAQADELKGRGENFLTLAHAQAWVLIVSFESKAMLFTRASMSVARAVRLINMLGLHRTDADDGDELPPMLPPAATWAEKEERRRVFWGAFASDSHATIATGWPSTIQLFEVGSFVASLLDVGENTINIYIFQCVIRLPASEEAFKSNQEEETSFIEDVLTGAPYAGFAGTIVFCHMFKLIMPHVHRPRQNDHPEDLMDGPFWIRHREIDNQLSSLFMFLPEKFRLPQHNRDPVAVHTNLNLHASIICLHHAAIEMATKYNLPDSIKQSSISRLRTAAEEVANIVKVTSHSQAFFKSPMSALSLYTATTVYIYVAKHYRDTLTPIDIANVETIIQAMEAIGRAHKITRAFLQQTCLDIERHDLASLFKVTRLMKYRELFGKAQSNIPLLARSSISKATTYAGLIHSMGRDPGIPTDARDGLNAGGQQNGEGMADTLGNLVQEDGPQKNFEELLCFQPIVGVVSRNMQPPPPMSQSNHKRKRVSPSPTPDPASDNVMIGVYPRRAGAYEQQRMGRSVVESWTMNNGNLYNQTVPGTVAIPDRTNSTASSSPQNRNTGTETLSGSSHTSPGIGLGNTAEENKVDLRPFLGRIPTPIWQATEETLFGQADQVDFTNGEYNDPWGNMHGNNMYTNDNGMLR
ncbi:binuclear zinc transcription factor [Paramyrothecium foliicola]|nr:binuclear zinc transcription factor [Paramyrothecium foliicola]